MAVLRVPMPDSIARHVASPVDSVETELVAVLVSVTQGQPRVLTRDCSQALPAGPFESSHRSLQAGLRAWVETQTHHPLGYVEQLYTFADRDRANLQGQRIISVSYLGLTRESPKLDDESVGWQDWYRYFPWEDWREGMPAMLNDTIMPALQAWSCDTSDAIGGDRQRRQRVEYTFGQDESSWNEELVLQRYELLFEAGLVPEAKRRESALPAPLVPGEAMQHDHRRILATAMARLRAKIRYRPVVFELMPPSFTLLQLQQAFEAVAGRNLHKQNFRRFIEQQTLVEETGQMTRGTAGRPAKLFQFRGDIMQERAIAGSKLPLAR
ncbi:hypothetical protein [Pusillimonas sp. ANT_WB101]|uniref:NUDIX hydrolase n=1 Tax=Pusillimonas sp. ANT_WB101 TaxID=2597356 RepID=UPI0011EBDC29|nr:hypothetical protein [Pusillimonas sp. ANT_WB101]KAA0910532.1 hypothetical protein FQ179_01205 [Pusillimonas sp. ANT_WB101]